MDKEVVLPLNENEKKILEFIEGFFEQKGIAPSFSEIKNHFGFASYNSVQRYLKQLQTKKYLHLPGGNQKRAIVLLRSSARAQNTLGQVLAFNKSAVSPQGRASFADGPRKGLLSLPLLGKVAAGLPLEEIHDDEFVDVPPSLVRDENKSFTLQVKGNSMIEDGIFDGDIIVVQEQPLAHNGEIVVAIINNEATVKRFYFHQTPKLASPQVELRPANPDMESMYFSPEKVQIRGIVVGLMRKF
ncbi:MAG: transcriptional repressor LexA [Bdellovibrionota bacterium]